MKIKLHENIRRLHRRWKYRCGMLGLCLLLGGILLWQQEIFASQKGQEDIRQSDGTSEQWAVQKERILEETEQTIRELLLWQCKKYGVTDTQALLDSAYAADAVNGVTMSYIIGLRGNAEEETPYNFTIYTGALQEAMQRPDEIAPATMQKAAIVLSMLGTDPSFENSSLSESIGQEGIMTYVYGLMMLDTQEIQNAGASEEEILYVLLDAQLADGGFSLLGTDGDVDITAMVIQAMAPYYLEETDAIGTECHEQVILSVDRALTFLSEKQLADGSFESYHSVTSESISQVILALCALDKNLFEEEAFIKNGNTLYDSLMQYRHEEGGFSHTPGAEVNDMATSQAFCALSAVRISLAGENTGIYRIQQGRTVDYRIWLSVLLIILAVCYLIFLIIKKRVSKKSLFSMLLPTGIGLLLIWTVHIQTKEEYRAESAVKKDTETIRVYTQIRCDTVAGREDYLPQDGVILAMTPIDIPEGSSAFEVLQEACRLYDIQLEYEGGAVSKGFAYVEGIGYLYEYDFGDLSGWMYQVDGEFPSVGSGEYIVEEDDRIVWVYTLELGKDVGADGTD